MSKFYRSGVITLCNYSFFVRIFIPDSYDQLIVFLSTPNKHFLLFMYMYVSIIYSNYVYVIERSKPIFFCGVEILSKSELKI